MTDAALKVLQGLIEGLKNDRSRRWLINSIALIIFSILLYFSIAGYLLTTNLVNTELISMPTNLLLKITNFSTPTHILFLISIIGLLFLTSLFFLCVKDLYFRNRGYAWKSSSGLKDWDLQGAVIIEDNVIKIKWSQLGMILKNRSWRNYVMTFKFFIPKNISYGQKPGKNQLERGFGIIYRAHNLGQYYMMKIDESGFRPHINNNQLWEDLGPTITDEKPLIDWLDKWISVEIVMKNNLLSMTIDEKMFSMQLPTYSLVFKEFPQKYSEQMSSEKPTPYLPLTNSDVGSIGFRSAPLEEVHIKDLKVASEFFFFRVIYELRRLLRE